MVQPTPLEDALKRVGTASSKKLADYAEGVHWATTTGRSLEDLRHQACADRIRLAGDHLKTGRHLIRCRPPYYRDAISRFYYSMYHSARAVAFFYHKGDDHEDHSTLPGKLPRNFPDVDVWRNTLKGARGYRNDADYDPYPFGHTPYRDIATLLGKQADELVVLAKNFLRTEGCNHL